VDFVFLTNAKTTETRPACLCSARVPFHKRKVRDPKSATATIKLWNTTCDRSVER